MNSSLVIAASAAILVGSTALAQTTASGNLRRTGEFPVADFASPPSLSWERDVGDSPFAIVNPVVDDDAVFVNATGYRIEKYALRDGRRLWARSMREAGSSLVVHGRRLYQRVGPRTLQILNTDSGAVLGQATFPGILSDMIVYNDSLYAFETNGRLSRRSLSAQRIHWTSTIRVRPIQGVALTLGSIAADEGKLYIGIRDQLGHRVVAIDANTGSTLWTSAALTQFEQIMVDDDRLVLRAHATEGCALKVLDRASGQLTSQALCTLGQHWNGVLKGDQFFPSAMYRAGLLAGHDISNDQNTWETAIERYNVHNHVAMSDSILYYSYYSTALTEARSPDSGQVLWQVPYGSVISPILSGDHIVTYLNSTLRVFQRAP